MKYLCKACTKNMATQLFASEALCSACYTVATAHIPRIDDQWLLDAQGRKVCWATPENECVVLYPDFSKGKERRRADRIKLSS